MKVVHDAQITAQSKIARIGLNNTINATITSSTPTASRELCGKLCVPAAKIHYPLDPLFLSLQCKYSVPEKRAEYGNPQTHSTFLKFSMVFKIIDFCLTLYWRRKAREIRKPACAYTRAGNLSHFRDEEPTQVEYRAALPSA